MRLRLNLLVNEVRSCLSVINVLSVWRIGSLGRRSVDRMALFSGLPLCRAARLALYWVTLLASLLGRLVRRVRILVLLLRMIVIYRLRRLLTRFVRLRGNRSIV